VRTGPRRRPDPPLQYAVQKPLLVYVRARCSKSHVTDNRVHYSTPFPDSVGKADRISPRTWARISAGRDCHRSTTWEVRAVLDGLDEIRPGSGQIVGGGWRDRPQGIGWNALAFTAHAIGPAPIKRRRIA
jgi:hypothetical protein